MARSWRLSAKCLAGLFCLRTFTEGRIVINEASPDGVFLGPCPAVDFLELLNIGSSPVGLLGYGLADDHGDPWSYSRGFVFGQQGCAAPVLRAGARLLLCRNDPCSFRFGVDTAHSISLYAPDKHVVDTTGVIQGLGKATTAFELTWSRSPDGTGRFAWTGRATPGEENSRCIWGENCTDCPLPTVYAPRARRCVCPPASRRTSMNPHSCELCQPGKYIADTAAGDFESCDSCPAGAFSAEGEAGCHPCETGTYSNSGTVCMKCPELMTTAQPGSRGADSCMCVKGRFAEASADGVHCAECSWGFTTSHPGGGSKDDCIVNWRHLTPAIVACCATLSAMSALITGFFLRWRYWRYHRRRKYERMQGLLKQGAEAVSTIQFPMCLISLTEFLALTLTELQECHEGARDSGQLLFLDSAQNISRFQRSGRRILFFSYHWMSWEVPGPDAAQFSCMKHAASRLCTEIGHDPELFYLWLDVLGIPQSSLRCKELGVESLYVYASRSDYLVIICPPSLHQQTGEVGGPESYRARTWCRMEQMAHFSTRGCESIYMCSDPLELAPVSAEWMLNAVYVFEGETTCCRLRHPDGRVCDKQLLVPVVLAMYADLLWKTENHAGPSGTAETVWQWIQEDLDRFVPRTFNYRTSDDRTIERELFGAMIKWLREDVSRSSCSVVHREVAAERLTLSRVGSVTTVATSLTRGQYAKTTMMQDMRRALAEKLAAQREEAHDDDFGKRGSTWMTQRQITRMSERETTAKVPGFRKHNLSDDEHGELPAVPSMLSLRGVKSDLSKSSDLQSDGCVPSKPSSEVSSDISESELCEL
eukprot:TRINITY_DN57961_c0_g1_i1.p1 TRINITY_DN57961_c0_g1~~TRINITY_DN57961_c0_g1_i1.p1  ORF type:complete len:819 (-),score=66.94 TRINITY_DN57961_c0_g1_i1:72-2528(-)